MNLALDMSRGKPAPSQVDCANGMLKEMTDYHTEDGVDVRNYGVLEGIPEIREAVRRSAGYSDGSRIIIGGNASLNLMFDAMMRLYVFGTMGEKPWGQLEKVKFLCPAPGYDRHFTICETLGMEMIPIEMTSDWSGHGSGRKTGCRGRGQSKESGVFLSSPILRESATVTKLWTAWLP